MSSVLWFIRRLTTNCRNYWRRRRQAPDYVYFVISGSLPDLPEPRGAWWHKYFTTQSLSLHELSEQLDRVEHHPHIRGVVLRLRELELPPSRVQALQSLLDKLRAAGKEVIVWATSYKRASYQSALHADRILLQEGGSIGVLGLSSSHLYLGDCLDWAGLKMDAVQISPYKSAADRLVRSDMSAEVRQMQDWMLDSHYATLMEDIATGRHVDETSASRIIDESPYTYVRALEKKLVDGIVSEENLPQYLSKGDLPAKIASYKQSAKALALHLPTMAHAYFAVIKVTGSIVDGASSKPSFKPPLPIPFLFSERCGDLTVVTQARAALKDKKVKGILLYVDSGGGSATASEAMYAALAKLAQKKPVVAMMGSLAASGGYYVTTAANWVVARPGTLTGSIGVLTGKLVDGPLLSKLLANRITLSRGDSAELETAARPYSEKERLTAWESISSIYELFLRRCANARRTTPAAIDAVGGGRVWTGRQALAHGLIDELGGEAEAVAKLRHLTGLSGPIALKEINTAKTQAPLAQATSAVTYALESIQLFNEARIHCICPSTFLVSGGDR